MHIGHTLCAQPIASHEQPLLIHKVWFGDLLCSLSEPVTVQCNLVQHGIAQWSKVPSPVCLAQSDPSIVQYRPPLVCPTRLDQARLGCTRLYFTRLNCAHIVYFQLLQALLGCTGLYYAVQGNTSLYLEMFVQNYWSCTHKLLQVYTVVSPDGVRMYRAQCSLLKPIRIYYILVHHSLNQPSMIHPSNPLPQSVLPPGWTQLHLGVLGCTNLDSTGI